MTDSFSPFHALDVAEVARRTGLTSRALRFYEARGLLKPLRSASARRQPASYVAQAFVGKWNALLAPFNAVATPDMKAGVQRMYDGIGEWEGEADPGFDKTVFAFIQQAQTACR